MSDFFFLMAGGIFLGSLVLPFCLAGVMLIVLLIPPLVPGKIKDAVFGISDLFEGRQHFVIAAIFGFLALGIMAEATTALYRAGFYHRVEATVIEYQPASMVLLRWEAVDGANVEQSIRYVRPSNGFNFHSNNFIGLEEGDTVTVRASPFTSGYVVRPVIWHNFAITVPFALMIFLALGLKIRDLRRSAPDELDDMVHADGAFVRKRLMRAKPSR